MPSDQRPLPPLPDGWSPARYLLDGPGGSGFWCCEDNRGRPTRCVELDDSGITRATGVLGAERDTVLAHLRALAARHAGGEGGNDG